MQIIPRISIQQLFGFMALVAVFLAIVSFAYRGNEVAIGLACAMVWTIALFIAYGIVYWVLYLIASLSSVRQKPKDGNEITSSAATHVAVEAEVVSSDRGS